MEHFCTRQWKGLLWQKQQLQREEQGASTECVLTVHEIGHSYSVDVQDHGNKNYSCNIQWLFHCVYNKMWTYRDRVNFWSSTQKKLYYSPFSSADISNKTLFDVSQLFIFINKKAKSLQIFRKTLIKPPWLYHSTQAYAIYKNPGYSGL